MAQPMTGLRTLGAPGARVAGTKPAAAPKRTKAQTELNAKAVAALRKEFKRALDLKRKLATEAEASGEQKGRDANQPDKLRSIVASLEGMNRFAIAMNLITPAESRALWASAMKRGLYEGWRA